MDKMKKNKIGLKERIKLLLNPIKEKSDFELKLGQKWILIIGIITLIIGIGFFLKYSFEQGWIKTITRIILSYLLGIGLLIVGNRFRNKFKVLGLYLIGGGIAILYISTFAGFQIYGLLGQFPAFLIMILITIFSSWLSIYYDTKWLAVLASIGGFLTPFLLSTMESNQVTLMTYITILNLGILSIAFYKKWNFLNIFGFVFTYGLFSNWFFNYYDKTKFLPTIVFINICYLIYNVIPFIYRFSQENMKKAKDSIIIPLNSIIPFAYSFFIIRQLFSLKTTSIISITYVFVSSILAIFLYIRKKHRDIIFTIFVSLAFLFLIITTPIILTKQWITILWIFQALLLLWIGIKLNNRNLIMESYLFLIVIIAKLVVYDYFYIFRLNFPGLYIEETFKFLMFERYIAIISITALFYMIARLTKIYSLRYFGLRNSLDSIVLFSSWVITLFIILNFEVSSFSYNYLGRGRFTSISILWTLFSIILMAKGLICNIKITRLTSLGLFIITILKVFLFDMARYDTPYRILSFIVLGVILIGVSYLYHKFGVKILADVRENKTDQEQKIV